MDPSGGGIFEHLPGQPDAVAALQVAVKAPVHAYLLVGPPGVGLREAGLVLAGDINTDAEVGIAHVHAVHSHRT